MTPRKKKIEISADESEQFTSASKGHEASTKMRGPGDEAADSLADTGSDQNGVVDGQLAGEDGAPEKPESLGLEDALTLIEELREQYMRARADVDNIRKRAETDVANARKFALEGFARELLNV